jgi:protein import protein ZIM17
MILMYYLRCADPGDTEKGEDGDDTKSASIDLNLPRRSMLVSFTCNKCGGRSERLVNPLAWEKGMVIVQCEQCNAWHKIADAANMVEEYIFTSDDE